MDFLPTGANAPTTVAEALWHAITNPHLLSLYGLTFLVALIVPCAVTLVTSKWRERELRKKREETAKAAVAEGDKKDEEDESAELPTGQSGAFNRAILNSLCQFEIGAVKKDSEENSPFIPRDCLTFPQESEKREEANEESKGKEEAEEGWEKTPLLEEERKREGQTKKKEKKQRKKYKDPDPETAEVLRKLTEQGLHGKLATAQLRAKTNMLEERMTDEEREKERCARQEQLESIFKMMEAQKEKFGINEKEELVEQMKMYAV